ncbi:hypothetical protein DPMN_177124 [Dreissena polymorpha]|uniref:Uncharacterized protein n=1 Tax=Dreissena polymorpha TaxID=45954 RepID=A0A9D4E880_DREPO|nr:hypothetical protein DPMN_177124 [Dreissena polymorpha]
MSGETTIPNSLFPERYEDLCTLKPEASSTLLEEQFEVRVVGLELSYFNSFSAGTQF